MLKALGRACRIWLKRIEAGCFGSYEITYTARIIPGRNTDRELIEVFSAATPVQIRRAHVKLFGFPTASGRMAPEHSDRRLHFGGGGGAGWYSAGSRR